MKKINNKLYNEAIKHFSLDVTDDSSFSIADEHTEKYAEELIYCYEQKKSLLDFDIWTYIETLLDEKITFDEYHDLDKLYDYDIQEIDENDQQERSNLREKLKEIRTRSETDKGYVTVDEINPAWSKYDKTVAQTHLSNFGRIYCDSEYQTPIDNEFLLEEIMNENILDLQDKKNVLDVYACNDFRTISSDKLYSIEDSLENVAAFVAGSEMDKDYALVDKNGEVRLYTMGKLLDFVPDKQYLTQLMNVLEPMQTGKVIIPEVKVISEEEMANELAEPEEEMELEL